MNKPVLSEDEKILLKLLLSTTEYKYIVRNKFDDLQIFTCMPYKSNSFGIWEIDKKNVDRLDFLPLFNHLFQFIKWEDKQPYSIEKLLEMNNEGMVLSKEFMMEYGDNNTLLLRILETMYAEMCVRLDEEIKEDEKDVKSGKSYSSYSRAKREGRVQAWRDLLDYFDADYLEKNLTDLFLYYQKKLEELRKKQYEEIRRTNED